MRGELRRKDRVMTDQEGWELLERGFSCSIGTVDAEGWPYVVPQLYVVAGGKLYFHNTAASGHTRANIEQNPRVSVEMSLPGFVFPYGEKAPCETSVSFESVILFGTAAIMADREAKIRFFECFMAKYADPAWERPTQWPLLDATTVYEVTVQRLTAKRRPVVIAEKFKHLFPDVVE